MSEGPESKFPAREEAMNRWFIEFDGDPRFDARPALRFVSGESITPHAPSCEIVEVVEAAPILDELKWFMQDGDIDKIEKLIEKLRSPAGTFPKGEK